MVGEAKEIALSNNFVIWEGGGMKKNKILVKQIIEAVNRLNQKGSEFGEEAKELRAQKAVLSRVLDSLNDSSGDEKTSSPSRKELLTTLAIIANKEGELLTRWIDLNKKRGRLILFLEGSPYPEKETFH